MDNYLLPPTSSSDFRALQMTHINQSSPYSRLMMVVKENFHTRHVVEEKVKRLSKNEVVTSGTFQINNIEVMNQGE